MQTSSLTDASSQWQPPLQAGNPHAADLYSQEVRKIEAAPPTTTEALRLVKQRVGQDLFRQALIDYWDGGCAVTGIAVPELLRASYAKPWADCATVQERLNVFNGFLLCALFDRGLMTFDASWMAVFSARIDTHTREKLALGTSLEVRWLAPEHAGFLAWHREHVFECG